jgi:uncharacterized membrane-anchored protein
MLIRSLVLGSLLLLPFSLHAQDIPSDVDPTAEEAGADAHLSFADRLREYGLTIIAGPATVKLGDVAELKLPEGYQAVDRRSLKEFYEITQNMMGGKEVGVVIGPTDWMLFFDYDPIGYVKDDDRDELDADKLLKTMQEGQSAANAERARQGWEELRLAGWAQKPYYDAQTNNLKWALQLTSSADGHQNAWINESIRLLGRGGVMNVTLVTDTEDFVVDAQAASLMLAENFSYVAGQRYAEFREGDKVAQYGLAALVLGGAGAAAYKLGFLQKFWKLLAAGAVALIAGVGRIWNKVTGKNPS